MWQCSNDNPLLETPRQEFYFNEFSTKLKNNSRNVHLVNYRIKLQLTFFNLAQYWVRTVCFNIEQHFCFWGWLSTGQSYTTGAIFWVDPRLFPELLREMVLCYFSRCCYYLGLSLSSYYERYIQSFRLCRRFRFARLFRSFRKWPRRNGVNLLVKASRLVAMLRISTNLQFMFIENGWG